MIHIFLADQHYLVHTGLQHIILQTDDLALVSAITTVDGLHQSCRRGIHPDLFLFSPNITRESVTTICDRVKGIWPSVPLLAMLAHPKEACSRLLIEQGVAGVSLKSDPLDRLLEAIYTVVKGQLWLSPDLVTTILWPVPALGKLALTERELMVLQLIVAEKTNDDIARTLKIGERTVRSHLQSIYSKLAVRSRVGAAVQAVRLGLTSE